MRHPEIWESFRTLKKFQKLLPPVHASCRDGVAPLSFPQKRIWQLAQLNPAGAEFNVPHAFRLTGKLDNAALDWALTELLRRHTVLRSCFELVDGEPVQRVQAVPECAIPVLDLMQLSGSEKSNTVTAVTDEEAARPFDLAQGPVIRAKILKLDETEYVFLLNLHHIVYDAWSSGVLFKELELLYESALSGEDSPLQDAAIQYADYAIWQRDPQHSEYHEILLAYWQQHLDGISAQNFPTDFPKPSKPGRQIGRHSVVLSEDLCHSLNLLAEKEGVTNFMVLLAAFKVLLYTYLAKEDIFVCSPVASRNRSEIQKLIGYFVNFVIYRTDLSGDISFRELLARVCTVSSGAYAHQEMPIQDLVSKLGLYDFSLSQMMFSLQNADSDTLRLTGLSVNPMDEQRGTDFDFFFEIETLETGITINLRYSIDMFERSSMEALVEDYLTVLSTAFLDPDQPITDLLQIADSRRDSWRTRLESELNRKNASMQLVSNYVAPRDGLETKLANIWQELLGCERIGITDNFFELGGRSLIALHMIEKIELELNKQIQVSVLAQAQTIELLAEYLRSEFMVSSNSTIVPLQPHGANVPLFVVQPAACTPLHFAELARQMAPNQPVYGFEQQGMDGMDAPLKSVEEIASQYVRDLREVSPQGPYLLLGRCMGGIVAYEMAVQLQAQGDEVAFLGILDTQSPPRLKARDWKYYSFELITRATYYLRRGRFLSGFIGMYVGRARRRNSSDPSKKLHQVVMDAHAAARRRYQPAQLFRGVLQVFKNNEASMRAQGRWAELATDGLVFLETTGDHATMLEGDNILEFIEELTTALDRAVARDNERPGVQSAA